MYIATCVSFLARTLARQVRSHTWLCSEWDKQTRGIMRVLSTQWNSDVINHIVRVAADIVLFQNTNESNREEIHARLGDTFHIGPLVLHSQLLWPDKLKKEPFGCLTMMRKTLGRIDPNNTNVWSRYGSAFDLKDVHVDSCVMLANMHIECKNESAIVEEVDALCRWWKPKYPCIVAGFYGVESLKVHRLLEKKKLERASPLDCSPGNFFYTRNLVVEQSFNSLHNSLVVDIRRQ